MISAPWWQSGVIYQIYPRSFPDSRGTELEISRELSGAYGMWSSLTPTQIWINPIFRSPMADFGCDIGRL
jgi:alpha-glucosidase